jgi:hypothetical protein
MCAWEVAMAMPTRGTREPPQNAGLLAIGDSAAARFRAVRAMTRGGSPRSYGFGG